MVCVCVCVLSTPQMLAVYRDIAIRADANGSSTKELLVERCFPLLRADNGSGDDRLISETSAAAPTGTARGLRERTVEPTSAPAMRAAPTPTAARRPRRARRRGLAELRAREEGDSFGTSGAPPPRLAPPATGRVALIVVLRDPIVRCASGLYYYARGRSEVRQRREMACARHRRRPPLGPPVE